MDYKNKYRNQKNSEAIGKRMGIYWTGWSGVRNRAERETGEGGGALKTEEGVERSGGMKQSVNIGHIVIDWRFKSFRRNLFVRNVLKYGAQSFVLCNISNVCVNRNKRLLLQFSNDLALFYILRVHHIQLPVVFTNCGNIRNCTQNRLRIRKT